MAAINIKTAIIAFFILKAPAVALLIGTTTWVIIIQIKMPYIMPVTMRFQESNLSFG